MTIKVRTRKSHWLLTLAGVLILNLWMFAVTASAESGDAQHIQIVVDGKTITSEQPPILRDGRVYVPVRTIAQETGAKLEWFHETEKVMMTTPSNDQIVFRMNSYKLMVNGKTYVYDAAPFNSNGRTYLPLRAVSELLHTKLVWDGAAQTAYYTSVPLYAAGDSETTEQIAKLFGLDHAAFFKLYNQASSNVLTAGTAYKIVIPQFVSDQEKWKDLDLLATIIEAEAGYESLKGQIAIGNVILNRVEDERFPDTIRDVIYEPGQFTPVKTGYIQQVVPDELAYEAAVRALRGENYVKEAVYFYNPDFASAYHQTLQVIGDIGNHRFAK